MSTQTSIMDRHGAITPAADADPRQRALLFSRALGQPEAFREWLEQNWEIWHEYQRLADQMRLRGRTYYSSRAVLHVLRWHRALRDPTQDDFKVNNRWSAPMARLYNAMIGFDFFRTRESGE